MYRDEDYAVKSDAGMPAVSAGAVQNSFINRVFGWMFAGLAVTGGISWYIGTFHAEKVLQYRSAYIFLIILEFAVVIGLGAAINKLNAFMAAAGFIFFALLNGVTLSWIFMVYSTDVIAGTFFISSATFGVMGLIGYMTKRNLSGIGGLCSMALIGIIIASLVNMFWYNRTADMVISCIGVLVFVGLIAWDVQKLKMMAIAAGEGVIDSRNARKLAVYGALELYLDFINLFLFLLRLFGGSRR